MKQYLRRSRSFGAYSPARRGNAALLLALMLLLVGLAVLVLDRQNLYDWWQLRDYHVPTVVKSLADQDTLTPYARKVFYVNHPAIDQKTTFYQSCPQNGGEQTIVLGCYHGGQGGIFVLSVDDPRLNGVEQVTAAHEMLHAAYDRLSSNEKSKVNTMLLNFYHQDMLDNRLQKTIAAYKKSEPNDVVNEMHSIFGTEVTNLPPDLEQYYQRYFTDRSQVTAFAAQYQNVFSSRQAQVDAYDTQLAALKPQIDHLQSTLKTQQQAISDKRSELLSERSSGNLSAYNAGVPQYNALVDDYNTNVARLRGLVSQYNQIVVSRNAIAVQQDQLVDELSANAAPVDQ